MPNTAESSVPRRETRVIVIEDDADTLRVLVRALAHMGVDAVPAATCEAARYAADRLGGPDVVLADASLPDGSGVACAAELKGRHGCATVVISGHPCPAAGPPDGVDEWLLKPVGLAELCDVIRRAPGRRKGATDGARARSAGPATRT